MTSVPLAPEKKVLVCCSAVTDGKTCRDARPPEEVAVAVSSVGNDDEERCCCCTRCWSNFLFAGKNKPPLLTPASPSRPVPLLAEAMIEDVVWRSV